MWDVSWAASPSDLYSFLNIVQTQRTDKTGGGELENSPHVRVSAPLGGDGDPCRDLLSPADLHHRRTDGACGSSQGVNGEQLGFLPPEDSKRPRARDLADG